MVERRQLALAIGFESPRLTAVENVIDRDGHEDQAFGISVDSSVTEEGRELTNLLHAFSNSDSDVTIIAEVSRKYPTEVVELIFEMYVVCRRDVQAHLRDRVQPMDKHIASGFDF
jgi:hypothetical protein